MTSNEYRAIKNDNTITLVLFIDAASFQKSNNLQITAILAQIAELPPMLRYSYSNTLRIMFWQGSSPNFNVIFDKHLTELNSILSHGLKVQSIENKLKVRLFININDSVERAKVTNTIQYNGYYGCFHCMNPGEMINGPKRYRYGEYEPRTNDMYKEQVEKSLIYNKTYYGIKGPCSLARHMLFPSACILDCMHLCYLGTTKRLINRLFDSAFNEQAFYLAPRKMKEIDTALLTVKFTNESPRRQRSLVDLHRFKANELKNLIHHTSVFILKDQLPQEFYFHMLLYILFLRLLSQDEIDECDIELSYKLIHNFVKSYENLYGTQDLTFNLHAHLHLPVQVHQYGPINKCSAFAFEGYFHFCKYLYAGTRNIDRQIAQNMAIDSYIHFKSNRYSRNIVSHKLLTFIGKALETKETKKNQLINEKEIQLDQIDLNERVLFAPLLIKNDVPIFVSERAIHNSKELNSFCYDRDKKLQNNVVRIKYNNKHEYVQCCKFYSINGRFYCVCQLYKKENELAMFIYNNIANYDLDKDVIYNCFHRFFQQVCNQPNRLLLIPMNEILNKCTIMKFNGYTYISNLNKSPDHD